jgi:hypothetical protein
VAGGLALCREIEHAAVAVLEAAAGSELAHCDCVFAGQCAEGFYVVAVEVEQVLPVTHGEAFCWEMNGEFQNVRMDLVVLLKLWCLMKAWDVVVEVVKWLTVTGKEQEPILLPCEEGAFHSHALPLAKGSLDMQWQSSSLGCPFLHSHDGSVMYWAKV